MKKEMVSVTEAKKLLQGLNLAPKKCSLPLVAALGKWTAADIFAPMNVPSFDNSAMDGYAFAWEDGGDTRQLAGEVQAGTATTTDIIKGTAVRIFTGAPVPADADTILPQEWARVDGDTLHLDLSAVKQGMHVRREGSQCKQGQLILPRGTQISPGTIGLLASVGISEVEVFGGLRVSLILTGDEIRELGEPLQKGQIYNANGPALQAYLQQLGIDQLRVIQVKDSLEEVVKGIEQALSAADVLLLTGGISVGDYDFVKRGLEANGVDSLFYKVRQRPGKPLWVGTRSEQLVFALPGNPASVLACFMQYVKPCLQQLLGDLDAWKSPQTYPLAQGWKKDVSVTVFLKAKLVQGQIHILQGQESFNLLSFGIADGLVEVGEQLFEVEPGTSLPFYPWI